MATADRRRERHAARTRASEEGRQVSATGYSRSGHGEPLVLLHGLGSSRAAWDAIVPALAERFDDARHSAQTRRATAAGPR